MIAVQEVLSRVGTILHDLGHLRWTETELIKWVNDGTSEIVIRRPSAGAKNTTLELVQGTRQKLPPNANLLLDIVRNENGRPISLADRKQIDDSYPMWHEETPVTAVQHFTYDDRSPQTFFVYPSIVDGTRVEAVISFKPDDVATSADTIDLSPQYLPPLVNYIIWRSLSKESEYGNANLAISYYQAFSESIGTNNAMSVAVSPNQEQPK